MIYLTPLFLSLASRMAGDAKLKWLGVALYPVPYTVLIGYNLLPIGNNIDHSLFYPAICVTSVTYAWVFLWKLSGHADGFKGYVRDNTLSPVASFIAKKLDIDRNTQRYDALFLAIKGGVIAFVPAVILACVTGSYIPAIGIFCASVLGYPLSYWLGFNVLNKRLGMVNTAWGELLSGFFAGLGFLAL